MTTDRYRTLSGEGTATIREKASRFIAIAFPVQDEAAFKERVQAIAKEHHASRHVCYAWIMGEAGDHHRTNDAGEPAGTAGKPILNRIRAAGLTNCAVVVVRYFGGTLLGKPGLIDAYGEAAGSALATTPVVERVMTTLVDVMCSYKQVEAVRTVVQKSGGEVVHASYGEPCTLRIALPRSIVDDRLRAWRTEGIDARRVDQEK